MISSVDTYVYNELKEQVNRILDDEKITDVALARLDEDTRENFKNTFVRGKGKVKFDYVFPQSNEPLDARVLIQLGKAEVVNRSLGDIEGTFTYREGGRTREKANIEVFDDDLFKIELDHTVGDLLNIEEVTFSNEDNIHTKDNLILFNRRGNNLFEGGLQVTVNYIIKEESTRDPVGAKLGYTLQEIVELTPISTNIDTARCLDLIIKTALIVMTNTQQEQDEYMLQSHSYNILGEVQPGNSMLDRVIFGRPITLSYEVVNTLDYDYARRIKEFTIGG